MQSCTIADLIDGERHHFVLGEPNPCIVGLNIDHHVGHYGHHETQAVADVGTFSTMQTSSAQLLPWLRAQ